MFRRLSSLIGLRKISDEEFEGELRRILDAAPVPVFWLFGKAGSGKTSIVKYLTGADAAQIGTGFRPQTLRSQEYAFPSDQNPLVRFLDTRGLGEASYDPDEDIEAFRDRTHLMLVAARVTDHAMDEIVRPLRRIRRANPRRPVVLALTCLHEAYPQQQHPDPDPFETSGGVDRIPEDLRRGIERHRQRFGELVDRVVPIDLTPPDDGFDEPNFGGERLKAALLEQLPAAYRQSLLNLDEAMRDLKDLQLRRAIPYVISHSRLAATAAAVPAPWVDVPVVTAIQSHMIHRLAEVYGQQMNARELLKLAAPIAGRVLARMTIRGVHKVIPYVGAAANAAVVYAYTYGLGKACCWYFGEIRAGNAPDEKALERVWQQQLDEAARSWKRGRDGEIDPHSAATGRDSA
jgi:uncharacterized protein (DUF697 family)